MIDNMEYLHHMLLFAFRSGWHRTDVRKVHAPFDARFGSFFWLQQRRGWTQDAMRVIEDFPDRAGGTRSGNACLTEAWIVVQVIQDRNRSWDSSQLLWRMVSDLEDLVHDVLRPDRWRSLTRA